MYKDVKETWKEKRLGKDDFKILKVIGRGTFGKVYLVEKIDQEEASQDSVSLQNDERNHSVSGFTGRFFAMKAMKKELLFKSG